MSSFFGLKASDKQKIHKSIFHIVYGTEGAFDFKAVYTMPVYLKNFYAREIAEQKKKEKDQMNKQNARMKRKR